MDDNNADHGQRQPDGRQGGESGQDAGQRRQNEPQSAKNLKGAYQTELTLGKVLDPAHVLDPYFSGSHHLHGTGHLETEGQWNLYYPHYSVHLTISFRDVLFRAKQLVQKNTIYFKLGAGPSGVEQLENHAVHFRKAVKERLLHAHRAWV